MPFVSLEFSLNWPSITYTSCPPRCQNHVQQSSLGSALTSLFFFTIHNKNPSSTCCYQVELSHFTSDRIFFILPPPLVLESTYSLHNQASFNNLGTELVFIIIGMMFSIFITGPSLYALATAGAMGKISLFQKAWCSLSLSLQWTHWQCWPFPKISLPSLVTHAHKHTHTDGSAVKFLPATSEKPQFDFLLIHYLGLLVHLFTVPC